MRGAAHEVNAHHAVVVVHGVEVLSIGEAGLRQAVRPVESMREAVDADRIHGAVDVEQRRAAVPGTSDIGGPAELVFKVRPGIVDHVAVAVGLDLGKLAAVGMVAVVGEADDIAHHLGIGRRAGGHVHHGGVAALGEQVDAGIVPIPAGLDHPVDRSKVRYGDGAAARSSVTAAGPARTAAAQHLRCQHGPGFDAAVSIHGDFGLALIVTHRAFRAGAVGTVQIAGIVAQRTEGHLQRIHAHIAHQSQLPLKRGAQCAGPEGLDISGQLVAAENTALDVAVNGVEALVVVIEGTVFHPAHIVGGGVDHLQHRSRRHRNAAGRGHGLGGEEQGVGRQAHKGLVRAGHHAGAAARPAAGAAADAGGRAVPADKAHQAAGGADVVPGIAARRRRLGQQVHHGALGQHGTGLVAVGRVAHTGARHGDRHRADGRAGGVAGRADKGAHQPAGQAVVADLEPGHAASHVGFRVAEVYALGHHRQTGRGGGRALAQVDARRGLERTAGRRRTAVTGTSAAGTSTAAGAAAAA